MKMFPYVRIRSFSFGLALMDALSFRRERR
jgi:hypothetical protein